jgi:hypothetical protein
MRRFSANGKCRRAVRGFDPSGAARKTSRWLASFFHHREDAPYAQDGLERTLTLQRTTDNLAQSYASELQMPHRLDPLRQ